MNVVLYETKIYMIYDTILRIRVKQSNAIKNILSTGNIYTRLLRQGLVFPQVFSTPRFTQGKKLHCL